MRKISIAITSYNRYKQTIDSFKQVLYDDRIESITITDDCSTDDSCGRLVEYSKINPKIRVHRNKKNEDCYRSKCITVKNAINDWLILFDSDNTLDTSYLDALYSIPIWDEQTIYQPSWAKPYFDFRKWEGLTITRQNVADYADTHLMTSLNACNHFMNREEYLKVFDGTRNPGSSDSIFFQKCWLEAGNKTYITPNLTYQHFISEKNDGHYQTQSHKYRDFHENLMREIRKMR